MAGRTEKPTPRRQPRQARSRALVDAILQAAAEVLVAEGPERANTNRIAERAGVSVGSVYQYFPNKNELFSALGQRYVDQLRAALLAIWPQAAQAAPDQVLPLVLSQLLQVSATDPLLSGMLHLTAIPAPAFAPIVELERDMERLVVALLKGRTDLPGGGDPELKARIVVRALAGVVGRTLATEPERVTQPAFQAELIRLVEAYMGVPWSR